MYFIKKKKPNPNQPCEFIRNTKYVLLSLYNMLKLDDFDHLSKSLIMCMGVLLIH